MYWVEYHNSVQSGVSGGTREREGVLRHWWHVHSLGGALFAMKIPLLMLAYAI
jgi:hypothetical protein